MPNQCWFHVTKIGTCNRKQVRKWKKKHMINNLRIKRTDMSFGRDFTLPLLSESTSCNNDDKQWSLFVNMVIIIITILILLLLSLSLTPFSMSNYIIGGVQCYLSIFILCLFEFYNKSMCFYRSMFSFIYIYIFNLYFWRVKIRHVGPVQVSYPKKQRMIERLSGERLVLLVS